VNRKIAKRGLLVVGVTFAAFAAYAAFVTVLLNVHEIWQARYTELDDDDDDDLIEIMVVSSAGEVTRVKATLSDATQLVNGMLSDATTVDENVALAPEPELTTSTETTNEQ
jgi:hypothetical protein